jgi:hypothetical protein
MISVDVVVAWSHRRGVNADEWWIEHLPFHRPFLLLF